MASTDPIGFSVNGDNFGSYIPFNKTKELYFTPTRIYDTPTGERVFEDDSLIIHTSVTRYLFADFDKVILNGVEYSNSYSTEYHYSGLISGFGDPNTGLYVGNPAYKDALFSHDLQTFVTMGAHQDDYAILMNRKDEIVEAQQNILGLARLKTNVGEFFYIDVNTISLLDTVIKVNAQSKLNATALFDGRHTNASDSFKNYGGNTRLVDLYPAYLSSYPTKPSASDGNDILFHLSSDIEQEIESRDFKGGEDMLFLNALSSEASFSLASGQLNLSIGNSSATYQNLEFLQFRDIGYDLRPGSLNPIAFDNINGFSGSSQSTQVPKQLTTDYLNFSAPQLTSRPGPPLDKFYDYVDRYPFTLKQAFIRDYRAGKTASQHLWGQQHWLNAGSKQGRVLEVVTGAEDINDYGAYVENYGITLLDAYRKDPRAIMNGGYLSLFNWGKEHYNTLGKARGRQIDGGADFGAIIKSNPTLSSRWQDARIVDPTLSAFDFGHRNQNLIKQSLGVQLGQDTQEKLTGQYVYGLGANDVLTGTASDDILAGGFGDDLIAHGMGGTDAVYGGPGRDVFRLNSGGRLNIRDYRVGDDFIQLGNGLSQSDITLTFDGINNSTLFMKGSEVLASVYGTNPNTFNFAVQSDGVDNVYI